jgi:hypothetical protein
VPKFHDGEAIGKGVNRGSGKESTTIPAHHTQPSAYPIRTRSLLIVPLRSYNSSTDSLCSTYPHPTRRLCSKIG